MTLFQQFVNVSQRFLYGISLLYTFLRVKGIEFFLVIIKRGFLLKANDLAFKLFEVLFRIISKIPRGLPSVI